MNPQTELAFDKDRESAVSRLNEREASCSFPKGCICILRIRDLMNYMPNDIVIEGFRRGKAYRRAKALAARMRAKTNE